MSSDDKPNKKAAKRTLKWAATFTRDVLVAMVSNFLFELIKRLL